MPDNQAPDFGCPDENLVALKVFYDFCLVIGFDQTNSTPLSQYASVFIVVRVRVKISNKVKNILTHLLHSVLRVTYRILTLFCI